MWGGRRRKLSTSLVQFDHQTVCGDGKDDTRNQSIDLRSFWQLRAITPVIQEHGQTSRHQDSFFCKKTRKPLVDQFTEFAEAKNSKRVVSGATTFFNINCKLST